MNIQNVIKNNKILFGIIAIAIIIIAFGVPLALTGNTYTLTVYAIDENDDPVPSVSCRLILAEGSGAFLLKSTDSQGKAIFNDVPEGINSIGGTKSGYDNGNRNVIVGSNTNCNIRMISEGAEAFEIKVSKGVNTPLESATVKVGSYTESTDVNGMAFFTGVPEGTHRLTVSKSGYNTYDSGTAILIVDYSSGNAVLGSVTLHSANGDDDDDDTNGTSTPGFELVLPIIAISLIFAYKKRKK